MSDDDAIIRKKLQMRAMTPNSSAGYCVRQSEEILRSLEKENFNLKLKIYFLESKNGTKTKLPPEVSNLCNKEFMDLFLENEALKNELNEKKEIMSNALQVIELLEKQKEEQKIESEAVIEENLKRIEALKVRSKINKRKLSKKQTAHESQNSQTIQELQTCKNHNNDLLAKINGLKDDNKNKSSLIDKLSSEKIKLLQNLDEMNRNLSDKDNIINSLRNKLLQNPDTNATKLLEENKVLRSNLEEVSAKFRKLERECNDYKKIVREQAEIMKALNRTIEAKNDELDDYKAKIEFDKSFIQDSEINLNAEPDDTFRVYPFHNPLFGNFQSLYR